MKKINLSIILAFMVLLGSKSVLADSFKFPVRIEYKILKNDKFVGKCFFFYEEKTSMNGISSLELKNFHGLGLNSQERLITYMFKKDFSIYSSFILDGKTVISEVGLREGLLFDGKKGKLLIFKVKKNSIIQTEFYTYYPLIDLLTMFFITSKRVAAEVKVVEKFNFLIDRSIKIIDMVPMGKANAQFQGRYVSTDVLSITVQNVEILQFKIYRDEDGYCFPVGVVISNFPGNNKDTFELRADRVSK